MTRYESLYGTADDEKRKALRINQICNALDKELGCYFCPFGDRCQAGRNGVKDYLMEEVE